VTPNGPRRAETRLRPPAPRWEEPGLPAPDLVENLRAHLKLPAVVCAVLAARDVIDPEQAKRLLRPRLEHLHDAGLLADGRRAAGRIARSVRQGERIFVHGDYDVDGICATALLTRWLRSIGGDVVPFVPHRIRDGYDFSANGLTAAIDCGAGLIVTVDCGTVAHETVTSANEAGIDVVITDHHTVTDSLPDAYAVVNPQRPDCDYPEKGLCGTGLAWRVAQLVAHELEIDQGDVLAMLDLVALATVADLVPLDGENRVLVHFGLRRFGDTQVAGLAALADVAGIDASSITPGQLGFQLAPRINAAGRIGDSTDALRMLITDDLDEALTLARALDATNTRRREEDRRTLEEALEELSGWFDPSVHHGVVLAGRGWHPGVIGIVASRIVERVYRPVVMIALDGDKGRGSARSISGFHLYEAIAECSEHLERFGGHRQAAGMDIRPAAVEAFREAFNRAAEARLGRDPRPVLRPDLAVDLRSIDVQLVHWLAYLGPHGIGNPGPLFLARDVTVSDARIVGSNHLKVALRAGGARLDGIGFGLAETHSPDSFGERPHDVLFRLERNEWRGRVSAQAKLVDLRPSEEGRSEEGRSEAGRSEAGRA
jgi:single-stranded-DNA-specific exonuclease